MKLLDTIAQKFLELKQKCGAQSIGIVHGTGRPFLTLLQRFANCLGTPNICSPGHSCYLPRVTASEITCGMPDDLQSLPICDFYGFGNVYPQMCYSVWS